MIALAATALAALATLGGGDDDRAGHDPHHVERVGRIVARAHGWLVRHQRVDGSFSIERTVASRSAPVAVTSITALSYLAAGHVPDPERGPYGRMLSRALEWLVDACNEDGYFTADHDSVSKMHGQGYAVLALTQAYGMAARRPEDTTKAARMFAAIERGVELIQRTQGDQGGWYYEPQKQAAHEGSITVCMLQALRAARDIGVTVDTGVIENAERYLWRSQVEPGDKGAGKFRYALYDQRTTWALTAAALSSLNAIGDYGSDRLELGFDALRREDPFTGSGYSDGFLDYGALYAAQAYWHYRDPSVFQRWWDEYVTERELRQRDDGSFFDGTYGNVYATAMVSLSLAVPLGYLPLYQR